MLESDIYLVDVDKKLDSAARLSKHSPTAPHSSIEQNLTLSRPGPSWGRSLTLVTSLKLCSSQTRHQSLLPSSPHPGDPGSPPWDCSN